MSDDRLEVYRGKRLLRQRSQWRWRFVSGRNGKKLATGGESYNNLGELFDALAIVLGVARPDLFEFEHAEAGVPKARHSKMIHRAGRPLHLLVLR